MLEKYKKFKIKNLPLVFIYKFRKKEIQIQPPFELWLRHFVVRLFCDVWNICFCFFAKLLELLEGCFFAFLPSSPPSVAKVPLANLGFRHEGQIVLVGNSIARLIVNCFMGRFQIDSSKLIYIKCSGPRAW